MNITKSDILYLILLAIGLLVALFLLTTRDARAEKVRRERQPHIVQVETLSGETVAIQIEQPMGELPQVELLDADGWARGCDSSNGWTTGYQGNLALTFSPVTSDASVLVTFRYAPEMGDQSYDLVDGSQSLTREEWTAVTLAAGEVWNYVASDQQMSFDTTSVDAVLAAHDYLFQEACLRL
jgi:hypothetical protein